MPALFSGLYPVHTGIVTYHRVPEEILTLADAFRERGFVTAAFSLNGNSGRLRGLHRGFDYYFPTERILQAARSEVESQISDIDAVIEAVSSPALINNFLFDFLKAQRDEDVFLFLHAMDTHTPYLPDEEFLTEFYRVLEKENIRAPSDRVELVKELRRWSKTAPADRLPTEAVLELYFGAVRTADKHLKRFVDFLESEEMLDRSIVIVTADHGEYLDDHPEIHLFGHMTPMLLDVIHVPLLFYAPGRVPFGVDVSEPVQLADVMPTLLDLAGIPFEPERFDGTSLLLLMAGQKDDYFTERPIVSQAPGYWSVLLNGTHSPDVTASAPQVYDIVQDPREQDPLEGEVAQQRFEKLVESLARIPRRPIPVSDTIVNEQEVLEELKALGYIN